MNLNQHKAWELLDLLKKGEFHVLNLQNLC